MCVVEYEGDVCFWRGVILRVFVVDDDGGDVAVCYRLTTELTIHCIGIEQKTASGDKV